MVTPEDVVYVRYIVQGILVPCVFVIGLLGNSVSIVVLTRKRMRCTTNIYLTALAVTDIFYLTMVFLLSLQHYQTVHLHYEIYWKFYGLVIWLTDGCAYISIYIAVCFTIERFIAIRYPLKRQTFCTESLAKRVISGVAIFCLLSTISTAFEHKAGSEQQFFDIHDRPCEIGPMNFSRIQGTVNLENIQEQLVNIPKHENLNEARLDNLFRPPIEPTDQTWPDNSSNTDYIQIINQCHNVTYYKHELSSLGLNDTYTNIFFILTSIIFVFIPLSILATFNIILIILVRKSKLRRGEMTNASVRRSTFRKNSTVSQENRITVTLIAVVILFIVCQLPWAIYLIVSEVVQIDNNLKTIIGNVFNFLAAINAASNFFLYCVLSDKYRKTVKELIVGYKYRRRNMSISTSYANSTRRYRPASQIGR